MIGFRLHSQEVAYGIIGVFISTYVNTGLMLTIAHADFKDTPLSFLPVQNLYSDFSGDWYLDVGKQITMTMGIQAFMPYGLFLGEWGFLYFERWLDKRHLQPGQATSKCLI